MQIDFIQFELSPLCPIIESLKVVDRTADELIVERPSD